MTLDRTEAIVPGDHPCLAGHFPHYPVVPGVVILETVARALRQCHGEHTLSGIDRVKFLQPLLPDETIGIRFFARSASHIDFECHRAEELIAKGRLTVVLP